jgi:hypothetical protein
VLVREEAATAVGESLVRVVEEETIGGIGMHLASSLSSQAAGRDRRRGTLLGIPWAALPVPVMDPEESQRQNRSRREVPSLIKPGRRRALTAALSETLSTFSPSGHRSAISSARKRARGDDFMVAKSRQNYEVLTGSQNLLSTRVLDVGSWRTPTNRIKVIP